MRFSRWAFIPIDEDKVSDFFDRSTQNHQTHGTAKCRNAVGEAFTPYKDFKDEPMIVVRAYPNVQTAFVNCTYYHKYSQHRCNLVLDPEIGAGVYGYTDIQTLLNSLNWNFPKTEQVVIGVIYGYLHKTSKSALKVSLDPRSCKII